MKNNILKRLNQNNNQKQKFILLETRRHFFIRNFK